MAKQSVRLRCGKPSAAIIVALSVPTMVISGSNIRRRSRWVKVFSIVVLLPTVMPTQNNRAHNVR
jgi:hypothetical protein